MNPKLYILVGILLVGLMGYGAYIPISQVMPNYDNLISTRKACETAETELKAAKKHYEDVMRDRELKRKQREANNGKLKQIYEFEKLPSYIKEIDDIGESSLFGNMAQDVINLAKKSGLKVRSIEFFSELKDEPLLLGKNINTEEALAKMDPAKNKDGDKDKDNKNDNNKTGDENKTTSEKPAVTTSYKAYQADLGLVGNYNSLNTFVKKLNDYPYLVKIRKLESFPYPENPKALVANVSVVLYIKTK